MEASGPAPWQPCEVAGPAIFAYDGSELAGYAIEEAAVQLAPGRDALVVVVWQTGDVGFTPVEGQSIETAAADQVEAAAKATAAKGVELAEKAGFRAQPLTVEAAPTWKGLVKVAGEHRCGLIVIGAHHRSGLLGHLAGSVAAATASHFASNTLVIHQPLDD